MSDNNSALKVVLNGRLRGRFAVKFMDEASRRGQTPNELAMALLEVIIRDNLYRAVIDE